eukprot:gnl/TRDRNA2_/TRDRNA2_130247_c0_seq1.p1 gnl/TRDRNA2_/TRDRNA2_130247_c0~~gnl/TRDRNA2_/TRDRNA2_130247_c0_seq1.p1  ORF type:complete len:101 (+),score=8.40 gnl/TRDRNA2_/TRDRNA2_130247_c0_seq1:166-468(+)
MNSASAPLLSSRFFAGNYAKLSGAIVRWTEEKLQVEQTFEKTALRGAHVKSIVLGSVSSNRFGLSVFLVGLHLGNCADRDKQSLGQGPGIGSRKTAHANN